LVRTQVLYLPLIADNRTSRQDDIVELVLLLFRNMLHCPNPPEIASTRATLQDRAILAFEQVGIFDLIVSLANDIETNEIFVGLIVEIVTYALQGQSADGLLSSASSTADDAESRKKLRVEQLAALRKVVEKEQEVLDLCHLSLSRILLKSIQLWCGAHLGNES
jgi:hypothetical protein